VTSKHKEIDKISHYQYKVSGTSRHKSLGRKMMAQQLDPDGQSTTFEKATD